MIGDDISLEPASNKVLCLNDMKTRPGVAIRRFGMIPDVMSWLLIWPTATGKEKKNNKKILVAPTSLNMIVPTVRNIGWVKKI